MGEKVWHVIVVHFSQQQIQNPQDLQYPVLNM